MIIYKLYNVKGAHVASVYTKPDNSVMREYNAASYKGHFKEKPKRYVTPPIWFRNP